MPIQRNELHDRLALALKAAREKAGINQRDMAAKLGTNQTAVAMIETGKQYVRVIDVTAWCDVLKLDPIEFLKSVILPEEPE